MYNNVYTITKETYLQTFQYKIINRTVNCRYNLHKWKLQQSGKCFYCNQIDTIEHHLYFCHVTDRFWKKTTEWLKELTNIKINFTVCEIIFGIVNICYDGDSIDYVRNYLILLGKWFKFSLKCSIRVMSLQSWFVLYDFQREGT